MIHIRNAIQQDIPRILELYEELSGQKQDGSPEIMDRVFDQIISLPDRELLVAEKEGFVVGTIFMQITPNLSHDGRPWAILENMVVDGRYRRQGIGRKLVEYVFTRAREAGCYKVQLLSHKKRRQAHKFYRAAGFENTALGFRLYL